MKILTGMQPLSKHCSCGIIFILKLCLSISKAVLVGEDGAAEDTVSLMMSNGWLQSVQSGDQKKLRPGDITRWRFSSLAGRTARPWWVGLWFVSRPGADEPQYSNAEGPPMVGRCVSIDARAVATCTEVVGLEELTQEKLDMHCHVFCLGRHSCTNGRKTQLGISGEHVSVLLDMAYCSS